MLLRRFFAPCALHGRRGRFFADEVGEKNDKRAEKPVFARLSVFLPTRLAAAGHTRPALKSFLPARAEQKASADVLPLRR